MGEGLLTGAEVTQRHTSPKPTPAWVTINKARNMDHMQSLQAAIQIGKGASQLRQLS